jgi:hypothetical protein
MSKHTPGPWEHAVEQDGHNRSICVFNPKDRGIIADIGGGEFDARLANARLIAAAPELLAACQILLAVYAPLYSPAKVADAFSSAVIQSREAIAKATKE